ncbi:unnamed protein product, partial [Polarella glacialis]
SVVRPPGSAAGNLLICYCLFFTSLLFLRHECWVGILFLLVCLNKLAKDAGVRGLIDVPNPTLGVLFFACHLFYPLLLMLPIPFLGPLIPELFYVACCVVGAMTIWLAYNLVFVLGDFCVVCVSMYIANFGLIPMMHGLASEGGALLATPFFGAVPRALLIPFGILDAVMGLAVLGLYLKGGAAHARETDGYQCWLQVEDA